MKAIKHLISSFYNALCGIGLCIVYERNFRIHMVFVLYVLYFSQFYQLDKPSFALLLVACGLVPAFEAINTAVEFLSDRVEPKRDEMIKHAKDIAAAAVLLSALTAVALGAVLLWDISVFKEIYNYFAASVLRTIVLIVSIIASIFFIFFKLGDKSNDK